MAKAKSQSRAARQAASTPVQVLNTGIQIAKDDVKLDLKMDMAYLGKMVRTSITELLEQVRSEIKAQMREAKAEYSTLEQQLTNLAHDVVQDVKHDAAAQQLAAAMSDFTGAAYTTKTGDAKVNVEEQSVAVELTVCTMVRANANDRYNYSGSYGTSVDKTIERPFSQAMRDLVVVLKQQHDKIVEIQKQQEELDQQFAKVPRMVDKAESKLARAYFANELNTGRDVLAILDSMEQLSVPALTATMDRLRLSHD